MNKDKIKNLFEQFCIEEGLGSAILMDYDNVIGNREPSILDFHETVINFTQSLINSGEFRHKDETFECALCEREKSIFNRTEGRPNVCGKCSAEESEMKIILPSKDEGRAGCTYGDTEFDSESVVFGYNMAIDYTADLNKKK